MTTSGAGALELDGYGELLADLKARVRATQFRAARAANTEVLRLYWSIGHDILERQAAAGWGSKVVTRLAADLQREFPDQRGWSRRNLLYMRKAAEVWPTEPELVHHVGARLPWRHVTVLLDRLDSREERDRYAAAAAERGWTRGVLELQIRSGLRTAIGAAPTNFTTALDSPDSKRDAYVPIDDELADRVRAQARAVREKLPEGTATKLFPGRFANLDGTKAATAGGFQHAFTMWLSQLDITDEHGNKVKVTPHQFRHTFGTRLINQDVPQHIVQQFMDHASPEMTNHYARLHDKTLRNAWAKARKINIEGAEVEIDDGHPLADAQWLRTGIARAKQTLPNGYCGMPIQSDCEHANPCLTCPLFITTPEFLPEHEAQLRTTLTFIDQSKAAGHGRIAEKNTQIAGILTRIIAACKGCTAGQIVVGGKQTEAEIEGDARAV